MTSEGNMAHDSGAIRKLGEAREKISEQMSQIIVGQEEVIEQLLISLFSRGHCMLEGVPGLAKTLMISTLSRSLNLSFSRIQFTPDLMPADITGTEILEENRSTGSREMRFLEGPLFSNVVGRVRHQLSDPFFVLATQNPIEQEGTYPLPEAQQDRFMFKVFVRYPSFDEELEIARRTTSTAGDDVVPVISAEEIVALQKIVREVPVTDHVIRYTLSLVRQTRVGEAGIPDFVGDQVSWGAGPRSVQFMILAGKARALLHGRTHVSVEDIQALAAPVLRHRLVVNFAAESEGVTPDDVVNKLIEITPVREDELTNDTRFQKIFAS